METETRGISPLQAAILLAFLEQLRKQKAAWNG